MTPVMTHVSDTSVMPVATSASPVTPVAAAFTGGAAAAVARSVLGSGVAFLAMVGAVVLA